MYTSNTPAPSRGQAGFTLVEALVALIVMAFGMFAIAGFQSTLSRNSDVAKQRSEAVRLAQAKIEQLRSFSTTTSDGVNGLFDYVSDVVGHAAVPGAPETFSPTSPEGFSTNTEYTRSWTVTRMDGTASTGDDLEKYINVTVSWADRTGQPQSVTLRSIVSRSDPIDLGTLFTPPRPAKSRLPKNRNINIPYPALQLPGDMSSFKPPPSGNNYVFDNSTGLILGYCNDAAISNAIQSGIALVLDDPNTPTVEGPTTGCTNEFAYLLSGYIHFLSSSPSGVERNRDNATTNPNEDTRELLARLEFADGGSTSDCFAQRQKVANVGNISSKPINSANRSVISGVEADGSPNDVVTIQTTGNNGFGVGQIVSINGVPGYDGQFKIVTIDPGNNRFTVKSEGTAAAGTITNGVSFATLLQEVTIAESETPPPGYNSIVSRFVAYTCVIRPTDHDSDATTPKSWSGQFAITPQLTNSVLWTLGTAAGTSKLCRFTGDYIKSSENIMANSEHPLHYRRVAPSADGQVSAALDNQNYLVVPGDMACPDDSEINPLNDDYINVNTLTHQTENLVSPFGGVISTGTQWGGGGEPSDPLQSIPMF